METITSISELEYVNETVVSYTDISELVGQAQGSLEEDFKFQAMVSGLMRPMPKEKDEIQMYHSNRAKLIRFIIDSIENSKLS